MFSVEGEVRLFSNKDLRNLIVPFFLEQLLMALVGIACAMCRDWVVRGVIFWLRFRQGKWKNYRVI